MTLDNPNGFRLHPGPDRPGIALLRRQRHDLFRDMVVADMRRHIMTRQRWRRLVQYAAMLDISAIEAGELIAEARKAVGQEGVVAALHSAARSEAAGDEPWPFWVKLSLTLAILALLDATFLHWVF